MDASPNGEAFVAVVNTASVAYEGVNELVWQVSRNFLDLPQGAIAFSDAVTVNLQISQTADAGDYDAYWVQLGSTVQHPLGNSVDLRAPWYDFINSAWVNDEVLIHIVPHKDAVTDLFETITFTVLPGNYDLWTEYNPSRTGLILDSALATTLTSVQLAGMPCLCPGDVAANVDPATGQPRVGVGLSGDGTGGGGGDPTQLQNPEMEYRAAYATTMVFRAYDTLPNNGGAPVKATTSLKVKNLATGDYHESAEVGPIVYANSASLAAGSGVQFAMSSDITGLPTGDYQWEMTVDYEFANSQHTVKTLTGQQLIVNEESSIFGRGWNYSELPHIAMREDDNRVTVLVDSNAYSFEESGIGSYTTPADMPSVGLLAKVSNDFVLTDKYGTKLTFFDDGRIKEKSDRNGNRTTYEWSTISGVGLRPTAIHYANGRSTEFTWQTNGTVLIKEGVLPNGSGGITTTLLVQDGLLKSITSPDIDGSASGSLPAPYVEFTYDSTTKHMTQVDRTHVSPVSPEVVNYDRTIYNYHAASGTVEEIKHSSSSSCGCQAGEMKLFAASRYAMADPSIVTGGYAQGTANNPAPMRPAGPPQGWKEELIDSSTYRRTEFTTDLFGQIYSETTSPGTANEATTFYIRDEHGQITRVVGADPDGASGPLLAPITDYEYDNKRNLETIRLPNGRSQDWTYDQAKFNQVSQYVDEQGSVTNYQLNANGTVQYMQQVIGTDVGTLSTPGDDLFTQYLYSADLSSSIAPGSRLPGGLVTQVTDPLNNVTQFQYFRASSSDAGSGTIDLDRVGLVQKVTYADSTHVDFTYDSHRRLSSQSDELGRVTSFTYDDLGHTTTITQPDAYSDDSLTGPVTTFQYDTIGRLAIQSDPDPDESGTGTRAAHETRYVYSNYGNTLTVTETPRETGGASINTVYDYDRLGRVKKVTDAASNVTEYTYTALDQVDTVTLPKAQEGAPTPVYDYDYDLLGRLKQVTQPSPGARTAPTAHSNPSVTTNALALQSSVVLFDPASPSSAVFTDSVDADSALRYEIVSNSNADLFKSIRFATDGNGKRSLVLDYADGVASTASIVLKVTNSAGLASSTSTVSVSRTAVTTTERTVNTTTAGDQKNSATAALSDGTYVVVWEGQGPTSTDDAGIWFQRFDTNGDKLGSQTLVNIATTGVQGTPAVAASADGTFAVVWYDHANTTAARVVFRTFYNNGTAKMSGEQQYWSNLLNPVGTPAVVALKGANQGKYVMLWGHQGVSGNGDDIYAQTVASDGTLISSAFRINPGAPGYQQRPSIAAKQDGGFVVVWDGDGSYGSTSTVQHSIFLRSFPASGAYTWTETRVDISDNYSTYAATTDGGLVVVWQDQETSSGNAVVMARRFAADGTPISSEINLMAGVSSSLTFERPSVSGSPDGGFVVGWRGYTTPDKIMISRFDPNGNSSGWTQISLSTSSAVSPVDLVVGQQGGVFATWTATSGGVADVKAKLLPLPSFGGSSSPKQVASVEPGQAIFGSVAKVLVTFNHAIEGSLTLSAVSLVDASGTTISTGFSATRISSTQFLISLPSAQIAAGEYRLKLDTGLVSGGLASASITTFRILPAAVPAGGTTLYAYDELNRVTQSTDTAGGVTKYSYAVQSNKHLLVTESRYLSSSSSTAYSTTTYDYDQVGRLVLVTLPAVAGLAASTIAYDYDKNGNLLRTTDQRGAKTDYRYDNRGRLIRRYDPRATDGVATTDTLTSLPALSSESPLGPETRYTYTAASELEEIIGPAVVNSPSSTVTPHTKYEYDGLGRVKKVISADPTTGALSSSIYSSYVHDQIGNPISMTTPASGVTPLDDRAPTAALVTSFSYDTQSNLTKITLPNPTTTYSGSAPHIDYAYDDLGRRTQMVDELGRYTNYKYDGRSNLTTVIEANPGDVSDHSLTSVGRPNYNYQYDVLDNLLVETDPLGRSTQYRYDAASRLTQQIDALGGVQSYGYDALSRNVSQTDALGRVTDFEFDQRDQLRKVTEANPLLLGQTGYSSTGRPEHLYDYNAVGSLVKYTDPNNHITDYTFDYLGQLTDVYQPTVNSSRPRTQFTYDAAGNQTSVTDPMSRVTAYTHDALGRMATKRDPDPNSTTGSSGLLTTYGYDNLSQLVSVSMPDPANSGQYILTNYDYDAAGRLLRETQPEVTESYTNGTWVSTAHRTALNYGYDLAGQLVSFKDQMNLETTYGYDALGRQTNKTVVSPGGTYDPTHNIVTTFGYDAVGNQTSVKDPVGATTFTAYDALNRAVSVLDAREGVTRFGYDAVGSQTTIVDPVGNVNSWAFDRLNRLASDTDPLGNARRYGYDKAGNLTSQIDRNGHERTFGYDALDRRTAENWLDDSTSAVTRTLSWTYNAASDLTGTDDHFTSTGTPLASAAYSYHYDAAGRLDKSLSTLAGLGTSEAVFQTHAHDTLGRRTQLATKIGGTFSSSTFSVSGGDTDLTNSYFYDKQSRLTHLIQTTPASNPITNYKSVKLMYNDRGQESVVIRQSRDPNNTAQYREAVISYNTFDGLGRQRTELDYLPAPSSWGLSYQWGYDDAGRMTSEYQSTPGNSFTHSYDANGQLISTDVTGTLPDERYVHDLAGNRQNVGDEIGVGNQLLYDADFQYEYDDEGNRRTRTRQAGADTSLPALTTYGYDFRNRLINVTIYQANGSTKTAAVDYAYDTLDRRVSRTETHYASNGTTVVSQTAEYYVYDEGDTRASANGALGGGDVLFDFLDSDGSGSGAAALERRYLAAVDHVFAQENLNPDASAASSAHTSGAPAGVYWLIQDRLGTVRSVIDNYREVWNVNNFDSFGNRLSVLYPHISPNPELSGSLTRYGFTGQEYDELTELTWYSNGHGRGRWYDSRTNNFIQPDVIGLGDGPNVYSYVHNSPTNRVDPSGQIDGLPNPRAMAADMWGAFLETTGLVGRTETYASYNQRIEREAQAGVKPNTNIIVTQPPDGKLSGIAGGVAETITCRQFNLLTAYPTSLEYRGAIAGEEAVWVLGPLNRVVHGTDVYGGPRNRAVAAVELGMDVAPFAPKAASMLRQPLAGLTPSAAALPAFGPQTLGAAQAARYIPGYGWTDARYWRMVKQLQAGESLEVSSLRVAAELRQDAFPALSRCRYRGPFSQAPDIRGTYDWHNPAVMHHPGPHQTPHLQITTPDKTILRIEVKP